MKVCIVGLGAVGGVLAGWMGSRLPPGSVQLSALARGATLQALKKDGLRLLQGKGEAATETTLPLCATFAASADPAELGPQDLVIVAVKAPALQAAAPAIAALCGPDTRVLTAMNGVPWWFFEGGVPAGNRCAGLQLNSVDPGGLLARLIPAQQVIGCVGAFFPAPARRPVWCSTSTATA